MRRDRRLGRTGTRLSRFLLTRTGLVAVFVVLALCAALVLAVGGDDCPSTDFAGKCRMPRRMNW
ncbi:hypothetical protein ACOKM3_42500 [Streptomyces sp. BH106]|uniref:hypothetical protein n=1 Tax=Streptomyces sp. BH106 TaxID=3410409 RepID=UPI003CE9085D